MGIISLYRYIIFALSIPPTVLTIPGNIIFFITLLKTPSLHTPSNTLLGSLCVTDLLAGLVCQPLSMSVLLSKPAPCCPPVLIAYDISFKLSSANSLVLSLLITLDRYAAIQYPYRYLEYASCRKYVYTATGLFILSTIYAIVEERLYFSSKVTFWGIPAGVQLLILLVVLLIYTKICIVILSKQKKIVANMHPDFRKLSKTSKEERRRTHTVIIIVAAFIICYAPYFVHTFKVFLFLLGKGTYSSMLGLWANYFVLLNSCLNPMIYCARSYKIRRAAMKIFMPRLVYGRTSATTRTNTMTNTVRTSNTVTNTNAYTVVTEEIP